MFVFASYVDLFCFKPFYFAFVRVDSVVPEEPLFVEVDVEDYCSEQGKSHIH